MTSELKQLLTIISEIKEKSNISQNSLDLCQSNISEVYKRYQNNKMAFQDVQSWRKSNQRKFSEMKDYSLNQSDEFLIEMFVVMMRGVSFAFNGKTPRYHQMACLWLNVHSNKAILEVKTGEGKTMIVALTALYYALRGKKVDVFTSSETLAMTETGSNSSVRKLLSIFGISLGDLCRQRTIQPQRAYHNQVIYGTAHLFQADYLEKMFNGKRKFFKDRQFDKNHVAILDEVDALLIDRMKDSTRLSCPKPLFQCIKAILIIIHEIKKHLIQAKSRYCRIKEVRVLDEVISLKFNQNLELSDENYDEYIKEEKSQIYRIVKGALQKKLRFIIPNYLLSGSESYINMMVPLWINSSYEIRKYQENIHYTVCKQTNKIIPVDISTGTYQKNTKWMNGVHQFLELKHGVDLSVDTIVTNYESNLIFFGRYEHYLFGMTGTISQSIGTDSKSPSTFEQFLTLTYSVSIYKIPTAKKRLLKIQRPKLFSDKMQWIQAIYRDAKETSKKRMVLIIFNTIKQAMEFIANFPQKNQYNVVQLYDHDEYFNSLRQNLNLSNTIIVSTNLGGRGTDIQITNENILKNGGLYVMMTYFAPNWKIEEQAIGRAGRNGQPGSGCFYLNIEQENLKGMKIQENQQVCRKIFEEFVTQRKQIQLANFENAKLAIKNQDKKKLLLDNFCNKYLKGPYARMEKLNQIIQSRQRYISKCRDQLIEYYQIEMESNFAEEQWGIFLKRKIPQKQQGKEEAITANFDDFVRQYSNNRRNDDVNPGFFAQCASSMFDVCKEKSQKLFDQALSKNAKSWVNRYYKMYFNLKRQQGKELSPKIVQPLIKGLKQVCQIILVQFSLQLAIESATKMTSAKKQQLDNLKTVYMNLMAYLQSISQSFQKYVIDEKRRMKIKINMKRNNSNNPSFTLKGLRHLMCDFQMYQIQQKKEKRGLWATIWSCIISVVMTVVSVIVTVVAVVATPVIALCGGNVNQLWQGVGKCWEKTGQCWRDTLNRLSQIGAIGLVFLTSLVNGAINPAILSLIAWLYLQPGQAITSVPTVSGQAQSALKLVQIKGVGERCKQSQLKMNKIRVKFDEKAKEINKAFKNFEINLEMLKKKQDKSIDQIKVIEDFVFSQEKISNLNQNASQNQQQNRKTNLTSKICIQKKLHQKANSEIKNLNNQKQLLKKNVLNIAKSALEGITNKFNQSVRATQTQLNKKIAQNKAVQSDVDTFQNDYDHNCQYFDKLNDSFNDYVSKNIKIEKVSDFQKASTITSNIAFKNIDIQSIKNQVNKIQAPIKQFVEKVEEANQINQIFDSKQIINEPLSISTKNIKNPQLKNMINEVQQQYFNGLGELLEQKQKKKIQQVREATDKQADAAASELFNKMAELAQTCKKSPIKYPSQINKPYFYEQVLQYKCIAQAIKFHKTQSQEQLSKILKEVVNNEAVILFNTTVIYKRKDNYLLKCYEKKSQSNQKEVKIIKSCLKNLSIKYSDSEGCASCGNAIISDLNKFIFSDQIGQKTQLISQRDVKKQYLNALIIQEIIQRGESLSEVFNKRKNSNGPSLPLHFLPFQLGLDSVQFMQFGDKLNDSIFRSHQLIEQNDTAGIKATIQNVYKDLLRQQENNIKQDYPQFEQLVNSVRKKPSRREK